MYNIKYSLIISSFIGFLLMNGNIFAQEESSETSATMTLSGKVTDGSTGNALAGANVIVEGTEVGAATDEEGNFTLENVEAGSAITASVIGYEAQTLYADSENIEFTLSSVILEMSGLEVLASRADENTAVAYTDVSKEELALRLGSRDIPLAMNTVPSVYATGQGGGAGDSRINVRGFNQRNVAIMLNGVPVNDMENGWVYWSNWDGVSDAASSIQMQKGLSAVNLATPSVGGSMNIITDPAAQERRGLFKQEVGAWGFLKSTMSYHSGLLMDNKLALSATLVRKTGDGYYKGTWTDAYAYYFGASYNHNESHRFEFYALGAPQRHGQNRYRQNASVYDSSFAYGLDTYEVEARGEYSQGGRDWNQNVSSISSVGAALLGDTQFEMYTEYLGERQEKDMLNERENFFHKPQVSLNHYWTINDKMRLSSIGYWSGGKGGGTGTAGDIQWDYSGPTRVVDWDDTILENATATTFSYKVRDANGDKIPNSAGTGDSVKTVDRTPGISNAVLRNSNNRQSTFGLITKFDYKVNDNIDAQIGLDWRTAQIYHVKTVRDLLGGSVFLIDPTNPIYSGEDNNDEFNDAPQLGLGDPFDYNFTNTVDWLGFFAQGQYNAGPVNAFGMVGLTSIKYTHWNHFKKASNYDWSYAQSKDGSDADWVEAPGTTEGGNPGELYIEADPISAMQFKGGVMYDVGDMLSFFNAVPVIGRASDNSSLWANFGMSEKAPILDNVIDDETSVLSTDPLNEKFLSFELGIKSYSNDGTMAAKFNFYHTRWSDRSQTKTVQDQGDSSDDLKVFVSGINQLHQGIEFELSAQINEMFRLDLGVGYGNWRYTEDANGSYVDNGVSKEVVYALKDLKVGDMPQASFLAALGATPIEGANVELMYRFYTLHHADWGVDSREMPAARNLVYKTPAYGIMDLHASYQIPYELGPVSPEVYLQVFNLLNTVYIQDASDNSKYNGFNGNGTADDAEVFLGLPTSFNLGLRFNF